MKNMILLIVVLFNTSIILAQEKFDSITMFQKIQSLSDKIGKLNEIQSRFDEQQKKIILENSILRQNTITNDSTDWIKSKKIASQAAEYVRLIDERNNSMSLEITNVKAFIGISDAQNILNSDFEETMVNQATKILGNESDQKTTKGSLWKSIVSGLIKNQVAKQILSSNPITATVLAIANSAQTFIENKTNGGKIQQEQQQALNTENIKNYIKRMELYIKFYEDFVKVNTEFKVSIEESDREFRAISRSLDNYKDDFEKSLMFSPKHDGIYANAIEELFKRDKASGRDKDIAFFRSILDDSNVQKAVDVSQKWSIFQVQLNDFENRYRIKLVDFFGRYETLISKDAKPKGTILPILEKSRMEEISINLNAAKAANESKMKQIKKN